MVSMLLPKMTFLPSVMTLIPTVTTFLSAVIMFVPTVITTLPMEKMFTAMMAFIHYVPLALKIFDDMMNSDGNTFTK